MKSLFNESVLSLLQHFLLGKANKRGGKCVNVRHLCPQLTTTSVISLLVIITSNDLSILSVGSEETRI